MNKIAIFGATGMTGLCVLKSALEKGECKLLFFISNNRKSNL